MSWYVIALNDLMDEIGRTFLSGSLDMLEVLQPDSHPNGVPHRFPSIVIDIW